MYPGDPALHTACTSACPYDPYVLGVDPHSHMPVAHTQGWEAPISHPGSCISICDGFVAPTATSLSPDDPSSLDMMYARQLLDHCCAHCPTKSGATALPPSAPVASASEAKTPLFRASDGSVSSESASTPASLLSPLSSPSVQNTALHGAFQCQWAECQVCVPTLDELAAHVQKDHFAQMAHPLFSKGWAPRTEGLERSASPATWLTPAPETAWPSLPSASASTPAPASAPTSTPSSAPALGPAPGPAPALSHTSEEMPAAGTSHPEASQRHPCGWIHCTASFATHAELTAHITNVHVGSGKTEYECGWVGCERAQQGRKFSQKQKVLRHIQTHTGDRPYVCSECHKRFSEANTLAQHMRIHTNERPYKCDFPGCNKAFSVVGSLTIHKRTHTGDRPFKCPYPGCGKQFSESSNLNKHIRVHRGDKPFKCPECARCFTRPDQMARHRKVHAKAHAAAASAAVAAPFLKHARMLQVGGHPGTVHDHGAWVVKECLATEAHFYHETWALRHHPAADALQPWMPTCWGIADEHGHWLDGWPHQPLPLPKAGDTYTLYLENLTAPFVHANVCDIKLGTVLYDDMNPHVPAEKRTKMERKARETTSAQHGMRITGWSMWDAHAHRTALVGKGPGRAARSLDDLHALLRQALGTDDALRAQLVRTHLLPRIDALRLALAAMPLRLRSASVLIVLYWTCA
ncbi:zinc-finger protein [Malassezia nana]|uniref:Zinc-finger protein n=1 Tax=Malassezia nana TaxID=180528 RepID=A0AAF0EJN2_9BASI|nr:zinc-finger protein [Malassezia nana]